MEEDVGKAHLGSEAVLRCNRGIVRMTMIKIDLFSSGLLQVDACAKTSSVVSTGAPRGGAEGRVRARARPPLRGVLLPPRPRRRAAAAAAARRARAAAAHLHAAHAPHAAPPPAQRRAPPAQEVPGDLRLTSAPSYR